MNIDGENFVWDLQVLSQSFPACPPSSVLQTPVEDTETWDLRRAILILTILTNVSAQQK